MTYAATGEEPNCSLVDLADSLVYRAAVLLGVDDEDFDVERDVREQLESDFFEQPLTIAQLPFDSLAVVELLDVIEIAFDVSLFDVDDIEEIASVRSLSEMLLRVADKQRIQSFIEQWRPPRSAPTAVAM